MFDYDDDVNIVFDAKIAGKNLVAAKHELLTKTGDFLFLAHSERELAYRMQMVESDIEKTAYRKLSSVSDSKAKLVRAVLEEWQIRHASCEFCKQRPSVTHHNYHLNPYHPGNDTEENPPINPNINPNGINPHTDRDPEENPKKPINGHGVIQSINPDGTANIIYHHNPMGNPPINPYGPKKEPNSDPSINPHGIYPHTDPNKKSINPYRPSRSEKNPPFGPIEPYGHDEPFGRIEPHGLIEPHGPEEITKKPINPPIDPSINPHTPYRPDKDTEKDPNHHNPNDCKICDQDNRRKH